MRGGLAAVILTVLVGPVQAELLDVSAECEAKVAEHFLGLPSGVDREAQRYPETTSVLPMRAEAGITREDDGEVKGVGLCFAQFKDPRNLTGEIPDELNIDAATYSSHAALSYQVDTIVVERRQIRPTSAETGLGDGEEAEFVSTFYIRGLLAAVSQQASTDLTGLLARVEATVVQERPGQAAQTVMTAAYELTGQAGGTVNLRTGGGADLGDVVSPNLGGFVDALDVVRVAILPSVEISYNYFAAVGEASTLTATLRVTLVSVANGTGVGAAFGMPGEKIGQTIDAAVGGSSGTSIVQAINDTIGGLPAPAIPFLIPPEGPSQGILGFLGFFANLCGLFGAETAFGAVLMLGWVGVRTRRG
jgi:hypothetical protein